MSASSSRHARLTSLVGTLLTVAVAGCLVAFSMVAQRAAQQSPGAPEIRPVTPQAGTGAPLVLGRVDGEDDEEPEPTASPDEEIDRLLALAQGPSASPSATEPSPEPRDGRDGRDGRPDRAPKPPRAGPDEPRPCRGAGCRPQRPPVPAATPTPPGEGEPDVDGAHCGNGHFKGEGKGHEKGRGKGHCEHEGDEASGDSDAGEVDDGHPGEGAPRGKDGKHGGGQGDPDGEGHPGKGQGPDKKDKGSDGFSGGSSGDDNDHPGNGHGKGKRTGGA